MVNSRVLQKLRAGDFVRFVSISRVIDPWLAEVVGKLGFDGIWFDLEHRSTSYDKIDPVSLACRATGIDLMTRIRKSGYDSPMRALEFGANGLMIPHVRSVEEAVQWRDWTRFPPLGKRGLDGVGADADWGLAPTADHLKHANEEVFLVLQVEDRETLDCVDEIAAVEGVDILFVGPGDLSVSLGVPLQTTHPLVEAAIDKVAAACAKHGKWWGIPTGTPEVAQRMLDRGARMVTCGSDHMFLLNGYRNAAEAYAGLTIQG